MVESRRAEGKRGTAGERCFFFAHAYLTWYTYYTCFTWDTCSGLRECP
jgi:hypothetical protein